MAVQIGRCVQKFRIHRRLSPTDLAYRCDIGLTRLSRIELGQSPPTFGGLYRLAEALGCSVEPLLPIVELEEPDDRRLQEVYRQLWYLDPTLRRAAVRVLTGILDFLPGRHLHQGETPAGTARPRL